MKEDETTSLVISASGTVLGALDPVNGSIGERDWDDDASWLSALTDPEFLPTNSMEAYFRTVGPHNRILQERQW